MKKVKRTQVLEDVPELMQHIQSRLPVKAAARTSVLSKSWLHAWSTIPTLRFHIPKEQERKHLMLVSIDRTLIRYLHDNIPIESFDLGILIENRESASLAEKWIRSVATKTCLKELSLAISFDGASFKLPDEILSGDNLTKIRVSAWGVRMRTSHSPPIINCVSLRELCLSGVRIKQQLLDHILSSCKLLAKIQLKSCSRALKTIKVVSLPCLNELEIVTGDIRRSPSVEINNVPNLRLFSCDLRCSRSMQFDSHSISLGCSVTALYLGGPGLVTDDAALHMIRSGIPFLESLTLDMTCWTSANFHFTCAPSIKTFSLKSCPNSLIDLQVNALKLRFFCLDGYTLPSLSFPISTTLEEITFRLRPRRPFGASFFLKMKEALELLSMCNVHITTCWNHGPPLDMDLLDYLKTSLQFPPAKNVQTLTFETSGDKCLWEENSPFFDAFFEICHPKHVFAKLKLRKVLENKTTRTANWPHYLKHVQIRTRRHNKLSNFNTSFLDGPAPSYANFILEWS